MKKYKIKDVSKLLPGNKLKLSEINGYVILLEKWEKNGVVKCKVATTSGWEYIVMEDNLQEIKIKSNKKTKK